jgi:hypothetical protein
MEGARAAELWFMMHAWKTGRHRMTLRLKAKA